VSSYRRHQINEANRTSGEILTEGNQKKRRKQPPNGKRKQKTAEPDVRPPKRAREDEVDVGLAPAAEGSAGQLPRWTVADAIIDKNAEQVAFSSMQYLMGREASPELIGFDDGAHFRHECT
jgi:hypothetical protein